MANDVQVVGDIPVETREAVTGVVRALEKAFNAKDPDALGEQYAHDSSWTNAMGRTLGGREEITEFSRPAMKGFLKDSRARYEIVRMLAVAPEVIAVNVAQTPVDASGEPVRAPHGRALYVIARREDGWKIVAGQNSAIDPPTD
ncbi:SgcJ/EcaC family oxidoreductase [Actinomadura kijaniata]|uniref:SgcJ/EcaC family oxidoreductase n=1 Tax=Actinomadura kijaniata TaxID=46161 RepID=UPI00082C8DC8|nr:SgcJ/EcaC family oxidoreductase [Actinomadura kijaniata]